MDLLHIIVPFIGAFIAVSMLLFLPLVFIIPEKYNNWSMHILFTISLIVVIVIFNSKPSDKHKTKSSSTAKKTKVKSNKMSSCMSWQVCENQLSEEEAFEICLNTCIVEMMEEYDMPLNSASNRCENLDDGFDCNYLEPPDIDPY